jgi:hypothetical protein
MERGMRIALCSAVMASLACGGELPGNSKYQGQWTAFEVNGSSFLGGFNVDDHGGFQLSPGGIQISGSIAPDASVSGSVSSLSGGTCVLNGHCPSTTACSGTTQGDGCPTDSGGAPWVTFSLCRGNSC